MNQLNEELIAEVTKNINMSIAAQFEKMSQRLMSLVNEKIRKHRQTDDQSFKEQRRQKSALKTEKLKRCLRERIQALQEMYSKLQRYGGNKTNLKSQSKQINLKRKQSQYYKNNSNLNKFLYQRFVKQKRPYMILKYPFASQKAINRLLLKTWRRMSSKNKELYRQNVQAKSNENQQDCSQIQAEINVHSQSKEENQDKISIYSDQTSKMARLAGEMENFTLEDQSQFVFQNQNQMELKDFNFVRIQVPQQVAKEGKDDTTAGNEEWLDLKDGQQYQ